MDESDTKPPAAIQAVRSTMRQRRSALSDKALASAAGSLAGYLQELLTPCTSVAGYFAIGGEISVSPALSHCRLHAALTALPVLQGQHMTFVAFTDETPLITRRYGLVEPTSGEAIDPMSFDAVLLPLLAFDANGNRVGMGGGFYDRCFERIGARRVTGLPTPRLIGVAHAFQQADRLIPQPWDVPLDQVVTDAGVSVPARNNR